MLVGQVVSTVVVDVHVTVSPPLTVQAAWAFGVSSATANAATLLVKKSLLRTLETVRVARVGNWLVIKPPTPKSALLS
jgi:hypothetical protein